MLNTSFIILLLPLLFSANLLHLLHNKIGQEYFTCPKLLLSTLILTVKHLFSFFQFLVEYFNIFLSYEYGLFHQPFSRNRTFRSTGHKQCFINYVLIHRLSYFGVCFQLSLHFYLVSSSVNLPRSGEKIYHPP